MCAPSPPAAPDYVGAAQAQGVANKDSAIASASLSNPNIVGPLGNQTVTYANTGPDGNSQPTVTQSLNPNAQAALDSQQLVQKKLADLGAQGADRAQGILSSDFTPHDVGLNTQLTPSGQPSTAAPNAGPVQNGLSAGMYGSAQGNVQGPNLQSSLNTSNVAALPVNAGTTAQQAILSRLQPSIDQNRSSLSQNLANQGITQGSEAYNRAQTQQGQNENDLYTQAALQGLGLDFQANQQGMSNAQLSGDFANNSQLQQFQSGLQNAGLYNSAIGQNFSQGLSAQDASNQAQAQDYSQQANNLGLYNSGQAQAYNQSLQSGQFGNQAALQNYQQQLAQYNQPLNQIAALMSGSQIQLPQFQGYTGQNIQAAPLFQATQSAGNFAAQNYQNQIAGYNGMIGGIGDLVGSGAKAYAASDRRLKSNITRIGTHPLGIGIYEYDIFNRHEIGVMADEVERVRPEAVAIHPSGFKMVNYGALNA